MNTLIDYRSLQAALKYANFYKGKIDGVFGLQSKTARDKLLFERFGRGTGQWDEQRKQNALCQWVLTEAGFDPGKVDGLVGPQTKFAMEQWQNKLRDVEPAPALIAHQPTVWPRQRDMHQFYGAPGTNHTLLTLPYPMRIAWDKEKTVKEIVINKKCSQSAGRAFAKALDHYGYDRIVDLGLDLFGGCFNNRKMRGGNSLSTHAYAASLDMNPEQNQLRWGADRAAMAKPECAAFLDCFEGEGWISLGRERNYDWMHLQAVRL